MSEQCFAIASALIRPAGAAGAEACVAHAPHEVMRLPVREQMSEHVLVADRIIADLTSLTPSMAEEWAVVQKHKGLPVSRRRRPNRQPSAGILTVKMIAQQLAVDPTTVSSWIHSGQLPAANVAQGRRPRWRVQRDDLARFLQARQPPRPRPPRRRPCRGRNDIIEYY